MTKQTKINQKEVIIKIKAEVNEIKNNRKDKYINNSWFFEAIKQI